jgi:formylglycine-generating enzyme required for sulfatase activity
MKGRVTCLVLAAGWLAHGSVPNTCPAEMASIDGRFCIDRWENALDELDESGKVVAPHSPYALVGDKRVRAVSREGVYPQAHISRDQADNACKLAGKRLCSADEWLAACKGRVQTRYPYGVKHRDGYCNDYGVSPLGIRRGAATATPLAYQAMNDPKLNQTPGSLARTGTHPRCRSSYEVFDMVGNLHEWTSDQRGTFRGGYYLDTNQLGVGCDYLTDGHDRGYRDYSTGFRCCK